MENDFLLITDNGADLPEEYRVQQGIAQLIMPFHIENSPKPENQLEPEEFYQLMRAGHKSTTAQITPEEVKNYLEPYLLLGKDILYIAFSSGLSGTSNSAALAARQLAEKYPQRKVMAVDSLCASMGQGLLVYLANKRKQEGASIEEVARWVQENRLRVCHWVTVDDLFHLHRGGRVSKTSAIAGSMLGIKPILFMNDSGELKAVDKVRGRKQSLSKVVEKMAETVGKVKSDFFMLGHGDCEEDARYVADLVCKRFGMKDFMINLIGPTIASHSGPGTIALFLMGEHR